MSAIYHENSLIKTKIQIPDCGSDPVKRKRLLDWLNQNENCKIITVTAPAGYGKTFLISSFAAGRVKKQRMAWFTAEEEDNEEELFWSYFLYSFYGSEWAQEEIKQKAEAGLDHTISLIRLQLTHFINDITELGTRITMIIDNLEVITNQRIIEQLAFFIRHLPANAHMILSGRETPDIGFTKYKAAGEVFTLTYKELAFTQEETIAFFRHGAHIRLTQEEYAKISHVLEGWAAGMQLAVTTIEKYKSEAALAITENRLIHSYFEEEVMERVDSTTRSFLVRISVLEQFCPSLCDFVLQTENAAEVIQRLEKAGLFLIQAERPVGMCIDKRERWFRFHRLFREFLQTGMEEWEENQILSLYRQASEWFERKKHWKEAIHYAIWGREFEKAAGLLEKLSGQIGCRGEAGLLHKWNRYLPAEIVKNNLRLLLNSAWAYSSEGNSARLSLCMKEIQKFERIPAALQAEIAALYSSNLTGPQTELDTMLNECRRMLKSLAPKEFLAQLICFNIGSILLLKGRVKESLAYFEQCCRNSMETGNLYLTVISKKALLTSLIRNGRLQAAEKEIRGLLDMLADQEEETLPVAGLLYAQLAEINYQRNELAEALNLAMEGAGYGELGGDVWTAGENYLILEKIYLAGNDRKQYECVKEKALQLLEGRNFFDLGIKLECCHIQALIAEGKLTSASRRISGLEKKTDPGLSLVYPELSLLKADFYVQKANFKKAEEILLPLKEAVQMNGQQGLLCEVQALLSVVYEKMGERGRALNELEQALSLAQEQGNYQFFLNKGEWMEGLLKRLERKGSPGITETVFWECLLGCFEAQPENGRTSGEILSKREMEILNMVAQGAGNGEIADKLFVSRNTVKTHLLNIYTKLGVHSRTKAVSKAEALKLISLSG